MGDIGKFRLAIQSVVEFAGHYAKEGVIDFVVNFDGFTQDQRYNISFDLSFNKNTSHNENPLIKLLNELKGTQSEALEEFLLQNFEDCFDLISRFGIGIIFFPSLI